MGKGQRIGKWEISGLFTGLIGISLAIVTLYFWENDKHKNKMEIVKECVSFGMYVVFYCNGEIKLFYENNNI